MAKRMSVPTNARSALIAHRVSRMSVPTVEANWFVVPGGIILPEARKTGMKMNRSRVRDRPGLIWAASFGVWTFVSLAATATIYQLYRRINGGMGLENDCWHGIQPGPHLCSTHSFGFRVSASIPTATR